eukprot:Rmarinus@m.7771
MKCATLCAVFVVLVSFFLVSGFSQGLLIYLNIISYILPPLPLQHGNVSIQLHGQSGNLGVWLTPMPPDCTNFLKVVLYFHGNAENRASYPTELKRTVFKEECIPIVAFDYRGFGDSAGWPSEEGLQEDALDVWSWLLDGGIGMEVRPQDVILMGHSLGTGVVGHLGAHLAAEGVRPAAIVLEAPFTRISDVPVQYIPFISPEMSSAISDWIDSQLHHRFDTINRIHQFPCPVLILHSKNDRIVPSVLGERLYERAIIEGKEDIDIQLYDYGSHDDLFEYDGVVRDFFSFLDRISDEDLGGIQP